MRRAIALALLGLTAACGGSSDKAPSSDRSAGCRDRLAQVAPNLSQSDPVYVDLYDTCMNRPKD